MLFMMFADCQARWKAENSLTFCVRSGEDKAGKPVCSAAV